MFSVNYKISLGIFLLSSLALAEGTLQNPVPLESKPSLNVRVNLYGSTLDAGEHQNRLAGTELEAGWKSKLTSFLELKAAGGLILETGFSRSRFLDDYKPKQALRLREAKAVLSPIQGLGFELGAIDQEDWQSPLLFQRQSFPAIKEHAFLDFENISVKVEAIQAAAQDTSTVQKLGDWPNGMPEFYLERISLRNNHRRLKALGSLSHWMFRELSSPMAFHARYLGNTVDGTGPENSTFTNNFQGFAAQANVSLDAGSITPEIQLEALRNTQASAGQRDAYRIALLGATRVDANWVVVPKIEYFRSEADATLSLFRHRVFGQTNRMGWDFSLKAVSLKDHGSIELYGTLAQPIYETLYQTSTLYSLGMQIRIDYDVF